MRTAVGAAFKAVLPAEETCDGLMMRAELVTVDVERWREEIRKIAVGSATNQGIDFGEAPLKTWMNMLPQRKRGAHRPSLRPRGRAVPAELHGTRRGLVDRQNREADFMVILDGRVGILEVDGNYSHPPTRTVQDHARDRLFKQHGIKLIEHFDWRECYSDADHVVGRFLDLLKQS